MTQLVILGLDALDIELIGEFGLSGSFGTHQQKIDTIINEQINEPHTREVWPSIITGLEPDEHGIHAVNEDGTVQWDNLLLDVASTVATGIIPKSIRTEIGKRLRNRGAALDAKPHEYYTENEIETVFETTNATALSIPNYLTGRDKRLEFDANRDALWKSLLVDRDGANGYTPAIETDRVYDLLLGEFGRRVGVTYNALQQGESLVFTWFGVLDTIGHIAPTMPVPIQRDLYQIVANQVQLFREMDDVKTVCLSDHGLQNGEHTDYATVASDDAAIGEIDHVTDVKDWIEIQHPTPGKEDTSAQTRTQDELKSQLANLGYIDQ